ncbi:unnamed protein product [Schistocephalus solidus]|uniref:DUF1214 domain-containing protein n=1 Tax=Schistocephalus solidus TaxID=70667 RepID=A0A183SMH6_SCHSO|nr:unnamed protein product [Schistocephalus solidus]
MRSWNSYGATDFFVDVTVEMPLVNAENSRTWIAVTVISRNPYDESPAIREGARTYTLLVHDVWGNAYNMGAGLMPSNEAYLLSNNSELAEAAVLLDDVYLTDFEELGTVKPCIDYPEDNMADESEDASCCLRYHRGQWRQVDKHARQPAVRSNTASTKDKKQEEGKSTTNPQKLPMLLHDLQQSGGQ